MGSLQVRLFFTYLLLILVTLGLAAGSLFLLLGGYRDSISYGNLEDFASLINDQAFLEVQQAIDNPQATDEPLPGQELLLLLRQFVNRPEGSTADVAIVDRAGTVIDAAGASPLNGLTAEDAGAAESGGNARRCRIDVPLGPSLICVSTPLSPTILDAFSGTEAAAIVVARPATESGGVIGDLLPRLVFSGLIGVAAALLLGALMSRSIAAPLRDIARAARSVARGNYRQRVPAGGPAEVRELANDFNHMTGEVQRSQETLRELLINISHELKTPLTSISGFSQAMLDGTIDDKEGFERATRIVNAESARVLRLVEELLDLSRIESGQQRMRQETVDLQELFQHIGEVFALRSEEAGVRLELRPEPGSRVAGDFDRLEQVLTNLVDNAFRHTPPGGVIRATSRIVDDGAIQVTIRDTGSGIPPEEVPHLFERFYRGGNGGSGKGHGLGLAITREIVRAHGGDIRVASTVGSGTSFTFTLPGVADPRQAALLRSRTIRRSRLPGLPRP